MRVLLTGANGQLGRALQSTSPAAGDITALSRADLDIGDPESIRTAIEQVRPDWILNAAAYTAVDRAEEEPDLARAINETAVKHLAQASRAAGARLLHVSTDFVFDGNGQRPYRPDDSTAPLNVYGLTKRDGEKAALKATAEDAVIVRTAWVYSRTGRNFLTTMMRLMHERESLKIVDDQQGAPTSTSDLAGAIWTLIDAQAEGGIYHYTNSGEATWYEFAQAIHAALQVQEPVTPLAHIEPTDTAGFPTPAKRPAYSVLDCAKIETIIGKRTPWQDALHNVMNSTEYVRS